MSSDTKLAVVIFGGMAAFVVLYWVPTYVAFRRRHPNRWLIAAVNGFLGASGIGWAVALVWALKAAVRNDTQADSDGGESGLNLFLNDVQTVRVDGVAPGEFATAPAVPPRLSASEALAEIERLEQLRAGAR